MRAQHIAMPGPSAAPPEGWRASLHLGFRCINGRTVPARRASRGPLRVQRPFHPEGAVCHVYVLHPPGGIVGGDELRIEVDVETGAHALLTTPAAGKFYRSAGCAARQAQHLRVAAGAALEWLPQENIVYDGAIARSLTRIDVEQRARFMVWETVCLGRPAAGEIFTHGLFEQRLEVYRDGHPLLLECSRYEGGGDMLRAPWGMGSAPVAATMICAPCGEAELAAARAAMATAAAGEHIAATLVDGLLLLRYRGARSDLARAHFVRLWSALRPLCLGRAACPPRIWNT